MTESSETEFKNVHNKNYIFIVRLRLSIKYATDCLV